CATDAFGTGIDSW
nr:immunoglobulin heavy chain junction region [Macaca mulatta]MOW75620.1 immunoglobulin heavy chain junction region [Macaca mulatta]MOW76050.1 immunoglobulin heavy chain junction region [Macaca mulatta]MOW76159.1 immunoglobulin heavy chain junction region [Macaca mulatta]MOW76631.1 immunoglobulin heavy chain junction region [Macaca mulatta]